MELEKKNSQVANFDVTFIEMEKKSPPFFQQQEINMNFECLIRGREKRH